jgi:hypothetical protein
VRILNTVTADFTGRQKDVVNILMASTVLRKDWGFYGVFNGVCFSPKRQEVTEDRMKLHNEIIHNLNSSNIIFISKSRRMW